uniref:Uncharacterized protein n=1 Tax=Skeletonema marinoi TaxID=267567 RepID=A0A7S2P497_9STRA|mmetsp:Transcript_12461/g.21090  ORF Transcript_12461/g.21090 Transcript_12461/m.21090 type:complete len:411 (+) Transcript_12461:69-1301(+)
MMDLSDLPTGTLAQVSNYLPSPSRALFAVALNSRDSSSAIAGNQWDVLDFGDIEKDLAAKLSDEDIRGVLLSIDAVNNLKKLRLTNCIHVTGVGLEPLRGSTIMQQINLSLVGDHESPKLDPEPPISCAEVIPILDSIIERREDCSLEYLQFPKVWRKERNTESDFHAFLTRFNNYLSSRADVCLKCSCNLSENNEIQMIDLAGSEYGTQNYTCYDCMNMNKYCYECEDHLFGCYIRLCHRCEKSYCAHCQTVDYCTCCGFSYCVDCIDFKQCSQCEENTCLDCIPGVRCHNNCGKIWCIPCVEDGDAFSRCDSCNEAYCVDCCNSDIHAVKFCDVCETSFCGQCRVNIICKEWGNCASCYQFAFPVISEDKERVQTQNNELENENKEQRNEINELKRKVKDLTGELEEV